MKQKILRIWNIARKTFAIMVLIFCSVILIKGSEKSIDGALFLSIFAMIIGFAKNKKDSKVQGNSHDSFPEYYRVGSSEWNMRQH